MSADKNQYAGFLQRVVAGIADAILLTFFAALFYTLFLPATFELAQGQPMQGMQTMSELFFLSEHLSNPVAWIPSIAYYTLFFLSSWQATPGMRMLAIYITDEKGRRIGLMRALVRYVAEFFSVLLFGLGYLLIFLTRRRQMLHDLMAGTLIKRGIPN